MRRIDARTSETPESGHRERDKVASDRIGAVDIDPPHVDKIAPARGIVIGVALSAVLWIVLWYLLF